MHFVMSYPVLPCSLPLFCSMLFGGYFFVGLGVSLGQICSNAALIKDCSTPQRLQ